MHFIVAVGLIKAPIYLVINLALPVGLMYGPTAGIFTAAGFGFINWLRGTVCYH